VSGRQRKLHHSHEITDAFAEGWDAREAALPNTAGVNPYRSELEVLELQNNKRAKRQIKALRREVELWDQGWSERAEESA
jgi:hypothetical protein